MKNGKLIPVADVTEPTREEVMAQARAAAIAILDSGASYALVGLGEGGAVNIVAACDSNELFHANIALMTMLGAERVGEGLQNLPVGAVHAITMATGLKALSGYVNRAAQEVRTPASDASKTQH